MFNEFQKFVRSFLLALIACTVLFCATADAQRARFPDFFEIQPNQPIISAPGGFNGTVNRPPSVLQPPQQFPNIPAQPGFSQPTADPFQSNQAFPVFPRAGQPIINQPNIDPRIQLQPPSSPPTFQAPQPIQPNFQPNFQPGYSDQFGVPQYGSPQSPNQWPYQGTGSNWLPSIDWSVPQRAWQSFQTEFLPRLLERPRVRQTYMVGNNGNELDINDIELATTLTYPNFLQSNQPLRISPGFIFHFWDGPDSTVHPGFDLPAQAYSTYLSFDHLTNPANQTGLEGNMTVGFYSDFDNTSSDGIRLTGRLLGWNRLNPYTVGKLGVEYFDRVNVKLLPAFGVYMTPNPDMKLDLFFPRTKLSHRVPNFSDLEAWAYVGGEYGGGSWAIERSDGTNDQADINDVRAFMGLEWMGPRRVTGFLEVGYVFERELLYRSNALNELELQDTFMLRSGLAF